MKISKRQLRRIIKEEKARLAEQRMVSDAEVMERLKAGLIATALDRIVNDGDNILEGQVMQFVMDTMEVSEDQVFAALENLAIQQNLM